MVSICSIFQKGFNNFALNYLLGRLYFCLTKNKTFGKKGVSVDCHVSHSATTQLFSNDYGAFHLSSQVLKIRLAVRGSYYAAVVEHENSRVTYLFIFYVHFNIPM